MYICDNKNIYMKENAQIAHLGEQQANKPEWGVQIDRCAQTTIQKQSNAI